MADGEAPAAPPSGEAEAEVEAPAEAEAQAQAEAEAQAEAPPDGAADAEPAPGDGADAGEATPRQEAGGGIAALLDTAQRTVDFRSPTHVQPKDVREAGSPPFRNEGKERIDHAFKPNHFVGIRSLPNAVTPEFVTDIANELYDKMHVAGRDDRKGIYHAAGAAPRYERPDDVPDSTHAMRVASKGQRPPLATAPDAKTFLRYEYTHSDYDAAKKAERALAEENLRKRLVISDADFVVCPSLPSAPKGAGAFHTFEYALDPIELKDEASRLHRRDVRDHQLGGPMYAGIKGETSFQQAKMMRYECVKWLAQHFGRDWPASFAGVFEDENGALVCSFHASVVYPDETSAEANPTTADGPAVDAPPPASNEPDAEAQASAEPAAEDQPSEGAEPAAPAAEEPPPPEAGGGGGGGGGGLMSLAGVVANLPKAEGSLNFDRRTTALRGEALVAASPHGDVTTYMNHYARSGQISGEFALRKDPIRWGVLDPDGTRVSYVFWPPWVHRLKESPLETHHAPGVTLTAAEDFQPEAALISGRIPFGPQTACGQHVQVYVRTRERSFKF